MNDAPARAPSPKPSALGRSATLQRAHGAHWVLWGLVPPPTLVATSTSTGPSADALCATESVLRPSAMTSKHEARFMRNRLKRFKVEDQWPMTARTVAKVKRRASKPRDFASHARPRLPRARPRPPRRGLTRAPPIARRSRSALALLPRVARRLGGRPDGFARLQTGCRRGPRGRPGGVGRLDSTPVRSQATQMRFARGLRASQGRPRGFAALLGRFAGRPRGLFAGGRAPQRGQTR